MRSRTFLLVGTIVAISLGSADGAEAQKTGEARRAERPAAAPVEDRTRLPSLPGARKGQPLKINRANLSCLITGRANGGALILQGTHLPLAEGGATAQIQVFVRNEGGSHAGLQVIQIDVRRDGQLVEQIAEPMPPIAPSDFVPHPVPIDLPEGSHAWFVEARVDVGEAVQESDEEDNACELAFTTSSS